MKKSTAINIGERQVGPGQPCFLIAEIAQAHDGSLGMAHSFIDAAADSGVDAIKFQTHIASAESTLDEPFRVKFSYQDETRYDYWKRMEFTPNQWAGLAKHAIDKGLIFLSSAFSLEAVELLEKLNMPAWKIGSGEFRSLDLIEAMIATRKPLLLSTGMSRMSEITEVVDRLTKNKTDHALLQCTSKYPVSFQEVGLNMIGEFKRRYNCPAGLSDHSGSLYPALAALAQGADLIELHVVFDKRTFGPDSKASITFEELAELARSRDAFFEMAAHPVQKDELSETLSDMRSLFAKSLAPIHDLAAGTKLSRENLTFKKPSTGISADNVEKVLGKTLKKNVSANRLLRWEDLAE